ncbi:phosphonopyruvate decarboxylase [Nucisporomicrobium flavum]|uniref:phosphonopyruvate decarboxylase n=1 Tax=Nucisporomicrobium flavum TaxID=2785915 RepID=UPI003C2AC497
MAAATGLGAEVIVDRLLEAGFGPFTGVPCSFLGPVISHLQAEHPGQYLVSGNEGEAVALAAGARLAGRWPVVILQNSGLGNAVNPLTSLCHTLQVPVLLLVTWRGEPGRPDEPQHELMGRITPAMLTAMDVRHELLRPDAGWFERTVGEARRHMEETGRPFALVVPKGAVAPGRSVTSPPVAGAKLRRAEAIRHVVQSLDDDALIVATTGKTARELERDLDRPENLYVVGSMGCASSVALGIALHAPERQVVVLDGDGAALMRLEALAGIGGHSPENLLHIVLDNEAYESTGGQPTMSPVIDLPGVARACGYRGTAVAADEPAIRRTVCRALREGGPQLVRVPVIPGSDPGLGRPALAPPASAARFSAAVARPTERVPSAGRTGTDPMDAAPPVRRRQVLMNPGPVNADERVRAALAGPDVCHREVEFTDLLLRVRDKVTRICGGGDDHASVVLTGSGTAAVEAIISSVVPRDGGVLAVDNGHYGRRMYDIAVAHGLTTQHLDLGWGERIHQADIGRALAADERLTHVLVVHHETSTGMRNDVAAVAAEAHRYGREVIVDAVSSVGAEYLDMRATGIDWLAGSANKCLEGMPGLGFVCGRRSGFATLDALPRRTFSLDLHRHYLAQEIAGAPAFTPGVPAFYAFDVALDLALAEGVAARGARYARLAEQLRSGLERLGFRLLLAPEDRAVSLTAAALPPGVEFATVHAAMRDAGFVIYPAQEVLAGGYLRLSTMGTMTAQDVDEFLTCLQALVRTTLAADAG